MMKHLFWSCAALALALTAACATPTTPTTPAAPTALPSPAEAGVGRYTSGPWTFSTASYWVEGPSGVVVFDTQFVRSEAEAVIAAAERETGKRVVAAVVLHANPDKFNGTAAFQEHGAQVVTSAQVLALIPEVHTRRLKAFYDRYKPDYPLEVPQPSSFGDASTELELAGLKVRLAVLGAGCSEAHVAAQVGEHLFVGDLVAERTHSWLELGHTDAWLTRVEELEALGARFVHPGRGASGGPELLTAQRRYLEDVIQAVAAEHPQGEPDAAALQRIRAALEARYPGYSFPVFLNIGLPAEWRRQASGAASGL